MNLFCLGSVFVLFQLNIGWISNYVIKLIGFVLMTGGIREMTDVCKIKAMNDAAEDYISKRRSELEKMKKNGMVMTSMTALAAVCQILMRVLKPAEFALNVISIVLGTAAAVLSLLIFKMVYGFIINAENEAVTASDGFVNDVPAVTKLGTEFVKLSVFTLANLLADIVNRLVPVDIVSGVAGVVVAITKIIMYIMLIVLAVSFNKVRVDFNKKQELGTK